MKTIKSALLGSKSIIDRTQDAVLLQIKEILKEHRQLIITRILSDIPTYVDYKFHLKTDKRIIETVKDELLSLKSSNVNLDHYEDVVQKVLSQETTHLTNEPFYVEIDGYLAPCVQPKQLKIT